MIFFFFLISVAFGFTERSLFNEWKLKYNKSYESPREEKIHYSNFLASLQRIQKRAPSINGAIYGLTKFSDLSVGEFKSKILMKKKIIPTRNHRGPSKNRKISSVPNVYDWRNSGKVTPVKDQEQCGSCWAFSATETIESAWMLLHNLNNVTMKPLSPQQIVDCDNGDSGCDGGEPSSAYAYVMSAGGMETNKEYPYIGQDGNCHFQKPLVYADIQNWDYACHIEMEEELLESTYNYGPLSICVDAQNWQDYQSGIMTSWECAWVNILDHCVQAVGWSLNAPTPYWSVRNSWNTDWGENGYIRLEYGANTCGLTYDATYVISS